MGNLLGCCVDARVHQAADVIVHVHDLDGAVSNTSDTGVDSTGEPSYKKYGSFWGLFAIGSVTGLCTGILGGATGEVIRSHVLVPAILL